MACVEVIAGGWGFQRITFLRFVRPFYPVIDYADTGANSFGFAGIEIEAEAEW